MTTKHIINELLDYYRQMNFKESSALYDMIEDCGGNEHDEYAVTLVHESMQLNHIYEKYQTYILEHHERFVDNLRHIGFDI